MSQPSVVGNAKLNMSSVTVVVAGGAAIEIDMLMQVLTGFGAGRLIRAEDAQGMRQAVEHGSADLLVLDLNLGVSTATDILGWLRKRQGPSKMTPVMLVGAHVTPATMRMMRDAGADYLITKPVTPRVMFERLVWITKERRSFVECDSYIGPDRRVRTLGPPVGLEGRREGDLSAKVGAASTPNMSQADIDAMLAPSRKVR